MPTFAAVQSRPKYSLRWRLAQFLELRWWRRYLADQSPEEYLKNKRAYWLKVLKQLNWNVAAGAEVLDAGCGPAGVFIAIHERQRVTALDPLLEKYAVELPIFSRADYPGVEFLAQPLEAATTRHFAAIYCFNAINHVSDWDRSLDALTAMARSGTRLLLTSDVHRHRWLLPIFRALPGDALHPQQHLPEDYRSALLSRGWKIEGEQTLRKEMIFEYRAWVCVKE